MPERIQPTASTEAITEEYPEYLRGIVETSLQEHFGKLSDGWLNEFADKLSVLSTKVHPDVNERSLMDKCFRFSLELQQCLALVGLETKMHSSTYIQAISSHVYLVPENAPDSIIDPTIGQFVIGHNNVFVGTRQQLRSLVLNLSGYGKSYTLRGYGSNDPELLFEIMWGAHSKPYLPYKMPITPLEQTDDLRLIRNTPKRIDRNINKELFYPSKTITPNTSYRRRYYL